MDDATSAFMDGSAFRENREKVIKIMTSFCDIAPGVFIVYSAPNQPEERFTGSHLPFVQEALFYWLTGWSAPGATIVIDVSAEVSVLFVPEFTKKYEIWNGPVPTVESIIEQTGVDAVMWTSELDGFLQQATLVLSTELPINVKLPEQTPIENSLLFDACCIARTQKTEKEIVALRRASELTGEAIKDMWKRWKWHEGATEMEVQATFEYAGRLRGCKDVSFLTIVGAGQHSCYLHYVENTGVINQDDLVLLDCGMFYQHYAGDITRTFPASGKFSPDQKLVYNLLLKKQMELIEWVAPGKTIVELEAEYRTKMAEIVVELGLFSRPVESVDRLLTLSEFFFPHDVSHDIGVNVHDQCMMCMEEPLEDDSPFGPMELLKPGMVISMEPGIYFHAARLEKEAGDIPEVNMELAQRYARTVGGIRIEDDLLVTENGCDVLSKNCPKTVEEIEALMAH